MKHLVIGFLCLALFGCLRQNRREGPLDRFKLDWHFWQDVRDGTEILPCPGDSPRWADAKRELRLLDDRITRLDEGEDHRELSDALLRLIKSDCFRMAMETFRLPRPDSALSLKTWWADGGRRWLTSILQLGHLQTIESPGVIVIPPDDRQTLSVRMHPVLAAGLVCPENDGTCAAETAGWRRRAERAFEQAEARNDAALSFETLRDCREKWGRPDVDHAYQRWRRCLEENLDRRKSLPPGALAAPKSGLAAHRGSARAL